MQIHEAARVLALASAYDNRRLGTKDEARAKAAAWAEALDPRMSLDEAIALTRDHFATSNEYFVPAHLNRAYKALRARRLNAAIEPPPPEHVRNDPAAELAWRRTWRTRIADGHDPQKALT